MIETVPLTDFVHGSINAQEGKKLMLDESTAEDLERLGLLRIRLVGTKAPAIVGKAQDDGQGRLSSASPVALVSPQVTLHLPARGPGRPRKTGT